MNGAQNLTKPVAAKAGANAPLSNRRDWKYFDEKLAELHVNDVENIIARGRLLIEAKEELEPGSFEAVVKGHFDLSYARKLRIIAAHPIISHRSHANALPPSPETLYLLTTLPAAFCARSSRTAAASTRGSNAKTSPSGAKPSAARSPSTARRSSANHR
jgi:hypothetical protein